jgi:hypothetical protein
VPSFFENIQFISREVETDRPGSELVLLRMADVIFIQILRAYLARVPDEGGGFLGALRDPAATLLREGATLAKASQLTGYASEASFSHAFRQWAGVAPGVWRRKVQPPPA